MSITTKDQQCGIIFSRTYGENDKIKMGLSKQIKTISLKTCWANACQKALGTVISEIFIIPTQACCWKSSQPSVDITCEKRIKGSEIEKKRQ